MGFCTQCGNQIPNTEKNCHYCGAVNEGYVPPKVEPKQAAQDYNVRQENHMEAQKFAGLKYAEGEVEVRTYLCSDIYSPSSKGYLTVTNKRVIFQGMSSGSRVNQETWLDGVSGIDAFYGKDINTSKIIRSIVLMIIGLIVMMAGSSSASYDGMGGGSGSGISLIIGLLFLGLGILQLVLAFQNCFILSIYSSKTIGCSISIGSAAQNMIGNGALYTLKSRPTVDTDRMINELGALIQDLQTYGNQAVVKWKKR